MKFLALAAVFLLSLCPFASGQLPNEPVFEMKSPDFAQGGPIPKELSCEGLGQPPGLKILGVLQTTKTMVLIVDDPDVPNGTFTHWLVWNLPQDFKELINGALPSGATQGKNSAGKIGYFPPCPPAGEHRYYFRLYALDKALSLPAGSGRAALEKAMKGHVQKETFLMGRYAKGEKAGN